MGDKRTSYGQKLKFSLRLGPGGKVETGQEDIVLEGGGNINRPARVSLSIASQVVVGGYYKFAS